MNPSKNPVSNPETLRYLQWYLAIAVSSIAKSTEH